MRPPQLRAASGTPGRPNPTSSPCRRGMLRPPPPVLRNRDELVERRRQLLLTRPLEALAQDGNEFALRPPVDEHDETEVELLLVALVQPVELAQYGRISFVRTLLGGGAGREPLPLGSDGRVRVEHL